MSAVNDAPGITAVANRSARVGEAIALAIAASDIEDAAQDLVFTLIEGPQGLTISPQGQLQWTAAGSGQQTVRLRVTDRGGATAETSFVITVTPASNAAPQIAPVPAQQVDEGAALSFALSASDADHAVDQLVYSLVSGPAGAAVSPAGQFSWIATDQAAQQPVTVRVTDPDGAFSETSFLITVALAPDNLAPVPSAVAARTVTTGSVVIVPLSATDDLDQPGDLVWSLVSGPQGSAVAPNGQFSWLAGEALGPQDVTVRVTDSGGRSAETRFTVTVLARANQAPAIAPVANRAVQQGAAVSVQLNASDPDHAASALVFELVGGPLGATVSPSGQFAWSADLIGDQTITVRVTDPAGASAETSFVIAVAEAGNEGPLLAPVGAQTLLLGGAITLDLVATDPDDAVSALTFALESGPQGASVTPEGRFTWTGNVLGAAPVTVSVRDPAGNRSERTFTITVNAPANLAPVIDPQPVVSVAEGQQVLLDLTATDADGPADALAWELVSGPSGAVLSPQGRLTWLAPDGAAERRVHCPGPRWAWRCHHGHCHCQRQRCRARPHGGRCSQHRCRAGLPPAACALRSGAGYAARVADRLG